VTVWQLNGSTRLRWREFDGEWLVYDTGSGQTHVLDALGATVLDLIESGPQDSDQLIATLAQHMSAPDHASLACAVSAILQQLQALSLVELGSP
jgi:PqqD family protein of HPr-rel-A system